MTSIKVFPSVGAEQMMQEQIKNDTKDDTRSPIKPTKTTKEMNSVQELSDKFFWKAVVCELIATALFIMNVTLVVTLSTEIIVISFAIGMSVSVLAQIFGPISGAHLNPAVTLGLLFQGVITIGRTCIYIIAQSIGGILGSAITYALVPESRDGQLGVLVPGQDVTKLQAFFIEMILTILLMLTVSSSTSQDHGRKDFGFSNALAIGLSVTVAHLVGIPLTGSGINPARAFGPSVVTGNFYSSHWIYWLGPLIGGGLAGFFYRFVLSVEPKNPTSNETEMQAKRAAVHA